MLWKSSLKSAHQRESDICKDIRRQEGHVRCDPIRGQQLS
jgi:hypothetical protein